MAFVRSCSLVCAGRGRSGIQTCLAGQERDARDAQGSTPLDFTVDYKRRETAEVLLALGCLGGRYDAADAAKQAEWVVDPLWPQGYRQDLLADSDEGTGEGSDTGELEAELALIGDKNADETLARALEMPEPVESLTLFFLAAHSSCRACAA